MTDAPRRTACNAPAVQLLFAPHGEVRSCGVVTRPLGNVATASLHDIWSGHVRADLQARLAAHDYSGGCNGCGAAIAIEGRAGSYPELFDPWPPLADAASPQWPRRMEFNLSNSCNLQCIQCNGDLSSSIRTHREHRPPMERPYGDAFFDDLRAFIPHLEWAQFAGGEPFLASENYRVWSIIAETNPELPCVVITNATQWSPRIAEVTSAVRMGFAFSLDAFSDETFEAIRVGADHREVLANVERYAAQAARHGQATAVNHCLMPQNHHEFGDLLVWAEEQSFLVNVSVVRTPASASIAHLPPQGIAAVHRSLLAQADRVRDRLRINAETFDRELERIGRWVGAEHDQPERTWRLARTERLLEFPVDGEGPTDAEAARLGIAAFADDGRVHEIIVDADERIVSVNDVLSEATWTDGASLVGEPVAEFTRRIDEAFRRTATRVLVKGPDLMVVDAVLDGERMGRTALLPLRGPDGRATGGALLVGFRSTPDGDADVPWGAA